MCELSDVVHVDSVVVYKTVAKRKSTGRYYSLAMGFCYPASKDRRIPVVRKQRVLGGYFNSQILEILQHKCLIPYPRLNGFREAMMGRTSGFESLPDAFRFITDRLPFKIHPEYTPVLVKAMLYDDILRGYYDGNRVYAGRRISIEEEIVQVINTCPIIPIK